MTLIVKNDIVPSGIRLIFPLSLLLFIYIYARFVLSRNGNSLIEMNDNNAEEAACCAGGSARI